MVHVHAGGDKLAEDNSRYPQSCSKVNLLQEAMVSATAFQFLTPFLGPIWRSIFHSSSHKRASFSKAHAETQVMASIRALRGNRS